MTPADAEILRVNVFDEISGGRERLRMKYLADAAEHVATVVKRDRLDIRIDRDARLEIHDHLRVAAERNGEWIHADLLSGSVVKCTLRHEDQTAPGFFEPESAQRGRTAREKALADRQQQIEIVHLPVAL